MLAAIQCLLFPQESCCKGAIFLKFFLCEYLHVATGRSALVIWIIALISRLIQPGDKYGGENVRGLNWALILLFLFGVVAMGYLEYRESKRGKKVRIPLKID